MNFWGLQWWQTNEPDNTSQFKMGLEFTGNTPVEGYYEEIRGYPLKLLNKGMHGEQERNDYKMHPGLYILSECLFPLSETDGYQASHPEQHFSTFLADAKERNTILNLVLRNQELNMQKFLIQFLTFTLPSVLVLKI